MEDAIKKYFFRPKNSIFPAFLRVSHHKTSKICSGRFYFNFKSVPRVYNCCRRVEKPLSSRNGVPGCVLLTEKSHPVLTININTIFNEVSPGYSESQHLVCQQHPFSEVPIASVTSKTVRLRITFKQLEGFSYIEKEFNSTFWILRCFLLTFLNEIQGNNFFDSEQWPLRFFG